MSSSRLKLKPPLLASSTTTCTSTTKKSARSRQGKRRGDLLCFAYGYCFPVQAILKKADSSPFLCANCVGNHVQGAWASWTSEQLKPGASSLSVLFAYLSSHHSASTDWYTLPLTLRILTTTHCSLPAASVIVTFLHHLETSTLQLCPTW